MGSRIKHQVARYAWEVDVTFIRTYERYPQSQGKTTSTSVTLNNIRDKLVRMGEHEKWQNRGKDWCAEHTKDRWTFGDFRVKEDGSGDVQRVETKFTFNDRHDAIMFQLVKDRL